METKQRLLSKIDELGRYIDELESVIPESYEEYSNSIEKKRACERILQIAIEAVIDLAFLFYKEKTKGIPNDETSVIERLFEKKLIDKKVKEFLISMKGFRNILVHKYGTVDDELVFENLQKITDFEFLKEYFVKKI